MDSLQNSIRLSNNYQQSFLNSSSAASETEGHSYSHSMKPVFITLIPKWHKYTTIPELQTYIPDEHRCENPQENIINPNTRAYQKDYLSWSNWLYPGNSGLAYHR